MKLTITGDELASILKDYYRTEHNLVIQATSVPSVEIDVLIGRPLPAKEKAKQVVKLRGLVDYLRSVNGNIGVTALYTMVCKKFPDAVSLGEPVFKNYIKNYINSGALKAEFDGVQFRRLV